MEANCWSQVIKDMDELKQKLSQKDEQLKILIEAVEFYAHDYMFKRLEKEFPNFGDSARAALEKVKGIE